MIRRTSLLSTALVSVLCVLPHRALAQDVAAPAEVDGGIGDIVVTARKTEENLQSTPVAVTALNTAALERAQVVDMTGLQRTAPSLVIATGAPSSSGFTYVSMRGQGNLQPTVSNDPAVGIYVDGVYIARPSQGMTDLNDLERVEVLRGPQGTLFGRNTPGGALNILTRDPTKDFEVIAHGEVGNYAYRNAGIVLNTPITDDLSARVVYNFKKHDGYARNEALGQDANDQKSHFVRGKLKYDGGNWDITLSGDYNRITDSGQAVGLAGYNSSTFAPGSANADALANALHTKDNWYKTYGTGFFQTANPIVGTLSPEAQALYGRRPYDKLTAYGFSGVVNVDLGGVDLKSITAYRYSDTSGLIDTDGTPVAVLATEAGYRSKAFSQEMQLSGGVGDRFNYILGGYYSRETGFEFSRSQTFGFLPTSVSPTAGLISENFADVENITTGFFAQGYYELTDTIRATGGIRYTWDRRNTVLHNVRAYGLPGTATVGGLDNCVNADNDAPGVCAQTQKAKFDYPAWTAGLDWQATDDIFLYAKTSGAAKSGGWNTRVGSLPAFAPEKTKDVEAGFKATWLDRKLRTNIALFHAWQTGVQRNAAALTDLGTVTQYIVNAGDARVWGAEFEVVAMPWQGMEITGNLSLMDGKYKAGSFTEIQEVNGVQVVVDRSGEALPQLPKTQFNIGATQTFPTSTGELSLHADYSYISRQYFNPVTAAPGASAEVKAAYAEQNALSDTPGYGLLNARIAFRLDEPNVEFSIFGRNLTDKKYLTRSFADLYSAGLGVASEFIGEPMTWGIGFNWRFGG